jgi:phosphate transport system substrate-binding protein
MTASGRISRALLLLALGALAACGRQDSAAGTAGASKVITNIGSDTMVNLALAWAEAYVVVKPEARVAVTGGGSGTGITALINGATDIANASRRMKPEELELARSRGVDPREIVVAQDAIAVIVNPRNPVDRLTIDQLSDIFAGRIKNWREVGGELRPIVRLSREVNSGTHVYFLEAVVRKGRKDLRTLFAEDTLLLPSSEGITAEVAQNPNAIGYDGLGYVTDAVKTIAMAARTGGPYVLPSARSVQERQYPISRDLYVYTRGRPDPAVAEYLDWLTGPAAQHIVRGLGFVPIS